MTEIEHSLGWYHFVGHIIGKAMHEGILVDVAFAGFFLAEVCATHNIAKNNIDPFYLRSGSASRRAS